MYLFQVLMIPNSISFFKNAHFLSALNKTKEVEKVIGRSVNGNLYLSINLVNLQMRDVIYADV
jgi:hypothetical protein